MSTVTPEPDPRAVRGLSIKRAERLAQAQGGVVSRRQLYAAGVTRWQVVANLRARRWSRIADQSVCLHCGPPTAEALRWAAVFQGGPRAQLDGVSALEVAGLERFTSDRFRVSVPRGARVRRTPEFDIRQTRRWSAADQHPTGIARTRPAVAAVRAGLWVRSDRQAALVLTMAVQQGIVRAEDLGLELLRVRKHRRRRFLHAVVNDLLDGVRSLGELDVARECRRRGLPEPERQVLRRDGAHRWFLDVHWRRWKVVVEVDGIHHSWADHVVADALRQNALSIDGDTVLRLPLLGLRLCPDEFFAQIERALVANGFAPDA